VKAIHEAGRLVARFRLKLPHKTVALSDGDPGYSANPKRSADSFGSSAEAQSVLLAHCAGCAALKLAGSCDQVAQPMDGTLEDWIGKAKKLLAAPVIIAALDLVALELMNGKSLDMDALQRCVHIAEGKA
jgi:hypothetical protein